MNSAGIPENERERLSVLHGTALLDTPAEDSFDAITTATAQICGMPISIVCLVDSERVWIKSVLGLKEAGEIPRAIGFCPHTINQDGIFEVPDASEDNRFHDNPLVKNEPHFRYYAGAPLITGDGYALGTLCVMDYKPNELSEDKKTFLTNMAKAATAIIESKRVQEHKRLSLEHRLGDITEVALNEIYLINADTEKFVYANRAAQRHLGYSLNELKNIKWREVMKDLPLDSLAELNNAPKLATLDSNLHEATHCRKDGSVYPVESRVQLYNVSSNEYLIISDDITQRKQSEENLLNNEARYRELFKNAPDAIFIHDPEQHKFLDCNNVALSLLGYTREEILKLGPKDITPEFQPNGVRTTDLVNNVDQEVQLTGHTVRLEHYFLSKNGELIPCEVTVTRHPIFEKFVTVATVSDIRKRKRAEEREKTLVNELVRLTRINMMGALSSGLAHELNQPLTAISQYSDTALSMLEKSPQDIQTAASFIEKAHAQSMRAAEIIRRVRSFVGKSQPTRSTIAVKELVGETIQLLNQEIRDKSIELKTEIDESVPPIYADRVQLQQVLLNLIRNSIEAMDSQNSLLNININCARIGDNELEFSVIDTGPGIKQEFPEGFVTPLESNKPNGMGMGLCISNYIINAHSGVLWHDQKYTDGACMRFRLPINQESSAL